MLLERERRIRRKQAAIVSDDSLVTTHVIPFCVSVNHPLSMFLSFALCAQLSRTTGVVALLADYTSAYITTALRQCDRSIGDCKEYPSVLFSISSSPLFPSPSLLSICPTNSTKLLHLHHSTVAAPLGISRCSFVSTTEKFSLSL